MTAACWILLMVGAMITHGCLGQYGLVLLNIAYRALAVYVARGRAVVEPFTG